MRATTAAPSGPATRRRSLHGTWAFELFDHPDDVPPQAVCGPTPPIGNGRRAGADAQPVPGNWTIDHRLAGRGWSTACDHPHYTNVQMPFPGPPPALPEHNPTGVYRRAFKVPRDWRGEQLLLHIGGAESVHAVYLNDRFVGYGTDSRLPSEYDISAAVQPGDNHLAVVVVRYSAQSYLEDQDQWWMAGLHREVFIEARPSVHLADVRADADWRGDDGAGLLRVTASIGFVDRPTPGWTVRTVVTELDGRVLAGPQLGEVPDRFAVPYVFRGHRVDAHFELADVRPWSAERPDRYRVRCELIDPHGEVADVRELTSGSVTSRSVTAACWSTVSRSGSSGSTATTITPTGARR